ncbi:hypothetical protein GCM10027079_22910 [Sediminivirga luteola]|uniref:O-antigen ligase-related domain-containing protein n=1 Tax=Sediminivirga luteola TaxID=1774748 RepID=A0A8J2U1H7_9MICO|nr:hypothetical protein GCM10011333_34750 [Sediminivirga luteola]
MRLGTFLFFVVFLALLGGRFTLDRLSPALPAIDLRLLFVAALTLGALLLILSGRQYMPTKVRAPAVGIIFVWIGWIVFTSAWAPHGARITDHMIDMFVLAVFLGLAFTFAAYLPASATERIWTWFFVVGIIYFVGAVAIGPDAQGRIAAPGGGPNVFVRVMILAAIAAFFLNVKKSKRLPLLFIPLFALGSALSGSRGGLLAAAIVLFLAAIPLARRLGAGKVIGLLILGGVATTVAVVTESRAAQFVQDRFIQQTLVERYESSRDTITDQAWEMFNAHPILGVGMDGYYAIQTGPITFAYPHNIVLASAAEGGFIGVIVLFIALLVLLRAATKHRPLPPGAFFALLAGMFVFFASLFSGDYYDSRFMWFFLGLAAIEAARPREDPDPATTTLEPVRRGP